MRITTGLAVATFFGLTACSGSGSSSGLCSMPAIPAAYLAFPPPNATAVPTTNLTVDFGISGGPGRTWSVALVAGGATIEGTTPVVVTSLPTGAASPPWQSTTITDYASAMPTLQAATTYAVDVTTSFGPGTGACPTTSTWTLGSFTTS